ncbi:hypothetical protein CRE_06803 [Caenorhabditis remanei]|uniref:THAP-type domain-containing protein n=1 Tax=Caenorhabditis remanei TaxID=31234 RepID=E3MNW0_CAERE|nr:hypothetical protein CRE_06803 [Caenorhabditis remanei]
MQTLQQARLTTKPPPLPPPNAIPQVYRPPPVKAKGILRHRIVAPVSEPKAELDVDPKTTEYLSKFFASTGIPFDAIHSSPFRELLRHLNPSCALPEEDSMFKYVEKQNSLTKPLVNFQKTVGPLGVTIDVAGNDDEKYLVFSIHYFDDLYERKNIVYLRKLLLSEPDAESLLISIRRAVNNHTYSNVKFSSIVCPNDQIYNLVANSGVIKRYHICFYNYMSMFIADLMVVQEFSDGLTSLREFVRFVKRDAELYSKFRRMQLSKNADLDLPMIDEGPWENTCVFLTRCLVLHDTLTEYCERFQQTAYINNSTFNHLIYLQRLMQQCLKYCRELSSSNNTISQIIPAIEGLRQYIQTHDMGYRFQKTIKDSLNKSFGYLNQIHIRARYEMATLMDPRYAYRDIFPPLKWKQIESRVAEEFVKMDASSEKSFYQDISQMTSEERRDIMMKEFAHYRQVSFVERPEESDSPFYWWGNRQLHMEHLAVLAREIVATPATSIDASHFFSSGGKFRHLCKKYSYGRLDDCLSVAGINQQFRGRGATAETMTQSMQENLDSTAKRLQKQIHFGLYSHGSDFNTERRREEIIGMSYPPPPTMAMNREEYEIEEKPQHFLPAPLQMGMTPPHRQVRTITGRPIHLNGIDLNNVPKAIPIRQVPLQGKVKAPIIYAAASRPAPPPTVIYPRQENVNFEQKPVDLLEKEVKEEPVMEKVIKEEPLDEVSPPRQTQMSPLPTPQNILEFQQNPSPVTAPMSLQQMRNVTQGATFKRIIPNRQAPMPQNITPHNFVQKFTQQQKFVIKNANTQKYPPPVGIRSVPTPLLNPSFPQSDDVKCEEVDNYELFNGDDPNDIFSEHISDITLARKTMMSRLKGCNRRCAVCGHLEHHQGLKNVTIDSEKLLIMLGCIYRQEYTLGMAQEFMAKETKAYVCHVHYAETLDEIYSMLKMSCPEDLYNCTLDQMENVLITVTALRPDITLDQLKSILFKFAQRYKHLKETKYDLFGSNSRYSRRTPSEETNDVDDQEIIPKEHRQPRKQVLEADQHDGTVKVIEQENFKLPTVKPSEHEDCDNPGVCCYCSKIGARNGMLRVPRGADRLARWIDKLGAEFEKRLKSDEENLVCRQHFPEAAFSSRGRLLRGMIPDAAPEKVEVTYRIQGNNFLKLNEQKSGTDKNARIDLESTEDSEYLPSSRIREVFAHDHDYTPEPSSSARSTNKRRAESTSSSSEDVDSGEPGIRKSRRQASRRNAASSNDGDGDYIYDKKYASIASRHFNKR